MIEFKLKEFFNRPHIKKIRTWIGIFAVAISLVVVIWLIMFLLGYTFELTLFGKTLSFMDTVRILAEIVVGGLLLAALAFL